MTRQEEVRRVHEAPISLENSGVGDSRASGAGERVVQSLAEQVRMLRAGFEALLGVNAGGAHPLIAWLVAHPADIQSKYEVGVGGRAGYERMKGTPCSLGGVELRETNPLHISENKGSRRREAKLAGRWG